MSVWPPRIFFAFSSVLTSDIAASSAVSFHRAMKRPIIAGITAMIACGRMMKMYFCAAKTYRLRRLMLATRYGLESASQNLSDVGPAEEGKTIMTRYTRSMLLNASPIGPNSSSRNVANSSQTSSGAARTTSM